MSQPTPPDYRLVAGETFRLNCERLWRTMSVQADYGKWLIATVTAVHAAAIFGLATGHFPHHPNIISYIPFVVGLMCALLSGLVTWINFTLQLMQYEHWVDPGIIIDQTRWPHLDPKIHSWINRTLYLAAGIGILSALLILVGAWCALSQVD